MLLPTTSQQSRRLYRSTTRSRHTPRHKPRHTPPSLTHAQIRQHTHETNQYKQQIKTTMTDKTVQKAQYEHTIKYFKRRIGEELARIKCAQEDISVIQQGLQQNLTTEEREDAYIHLAQLQLDIAASSMMTDCLIQSHNQLEESAKKV